MRRLQEDLMVLGFPKDISILSFSTPNFTQMASILGFLVTALEPGFMTNQIDTEKDRVKFVKEIAIHISSRTTINLNTRSLYKSEYGCVKELLKLSRELVICFETEKPEHQSRLDISAQRGDLARCRQLARDITEAGADLYHYLENEIVVKVLTSTQQQERRANVLLQPVELPETAKAIQNYISNLQLKSKTSEDAYDALLADQQNLVTKIDRKKAELERSEKRLKSFTSVRPAYMDEYEKIEQELVRNYEAYMIKFRNLAYLEQLLDTKNAEERIKAEEAEEKLKGLQKRMQAEELELMRKEKEADAIGCHRGYEEYRRGESKSFGGEVLFILINRKFL